MTCTKPLKHKPVFLILGITAFLLMVGALRAVTGPQGSTGVMYQEDVNGDGEVTMMDALALLLLGRADPSDPRADYNWDGVYSMADVKEMLINIVRERLTPLEAVVNPVRTDEFLLNPGMGFCSIGAFYSWLKTYDSKYPPCANVYYRWYWSQIQPAEDKIDFEMIDGLMDKAKREGQTFCMRVMCQDGAVYVPQWLIDKGLKGRYYDEKDHSKGFQPDYSDPLFTEYHSRLIKALAERYDGDPNLYYVDIGSVGSWGEWNTAGAPEGFQMPSEPVLNDIIKLYLDSFTKTKLLMLIGDYMDYAIERGTGYRADCLGDWGMWSDNWSHMTTIYPEFLAKTPKALEAWKHSPVAFEACNTCTTWYLDGMGGRFTREMARDTTIAQSLAWHLSWMNLCYGPKFEELPDEWIQAYLEWGKKMGYRFVLHSLAHPSRVTAGGQLPLRMDWENAGVAPSYYAHPLAVQFRNTVSKETWVVNTDADIREWLPGQVNYSTVVTVPDSLTPGEYELGLAMLDRTGSNPRIRFAIEGAAEDGWYRLSRVRVH